MTQSETPSRKRPLSNLWETPENDSRPSPSAGSKDQERMDMSRGIQNSLSASDRIKRGDSSSFSAGPYQDANGGNEADGYHSSLGFTAGASNRLEAVSPSSGNIFEALGRWSDAVKLMSTNMDRFTKFLRSV